MRFCYSGYRPVLTLLVVLLVAPTAVADIELPKLFSDHMVLQQHQTMRINGSADANEALAVSFNGQVVEAVADKNGNWSAIIRTGPAGGPYQLEVASRDSQTKVVFNDVLVGEVWICSGQSNMLFPVDNSKLAQQSIEAAKDYPTIRGFNVAPTASVQPLKDFANVDSWFCCAADSIKDFSAIAYLFGRELNRKLDVPIGLILVAAERTTLESWTPYDTLKQDGSFDQLLMHWEERGEPTNQNRVSNSFNAMVAPLSGFGFRGVIWCHGEANLGRGAQYGRILPLMIQSWRKKLGQHECPFLFVQPTPFRYTERPVEGLPEIWDAQLKTFMSMPGTGMVVTTDLADEQSNQPANKLPVAQRLSKWAFSGCYKQMLAKKMKSPDVGAPIPALVDQNGDEKSNKTERSDGAADKTLISLEVPAKLVASGPIFESAEIDGNKIVINFSQIGSALRLDPTTEHGFTICGEDREFVPAEAMLKGQQMIIYHPEISAPIAVRYGWTDTAKPTLKNSSGLPASSFRTDEFPLLSDGVEF